MWFNWACFKGARIDKTAKKRYRWLDKLIFDKSVLFRGGMLAE
jgi:hypothetical protein